MNIVKFIYNQDITVSEAMQKIDANAGGILFLTDENKRLSACVTDGDIRRYLLSGGQMDGKVLLAANKHPRYGRTLAEAKQLYDGRYLIAIPIINSDMEIIDIYTDSDRAAKPKAKLNVPVVINAGGKGTRLAPYTKVLPKPLIPVGELPIIEHIMNEYQKYDCTDFHIIVNYKRNLMKAYFADKNAGYNLTWYDEYKPLGTGGGLSLLKGVFKDTFFFANCDVLLTANYESMLKFHKEHGNVITMICAYKNIEIPYGVVDMGVNGVIKNMREKPLISFLANTGIYIVEPSVVDSMIDDEVIGFPDIVERARQQGHKVAVYPVSENDWMDMGQITELEKMRIKLYGE